MHTLVVDIETRSSVDIASAGSYKYAMSEDFQILLIAYKYDDKPTVVWDLPQLEKDGATSALDQFKLWLIDPTIIKVAHNAAFEWWCLNQAGYITPIEQWRCTMVHSMYCGYAASLEAAGAAIGIPRDKQKLMTGKALIRYFCTPANPTNENGGRKWNEPKHDPGKWEQFKVYNEQDVEAEYNIMLRLNRFPMPEKELNVWRQETMMNAFGVRFDRKLIDGAVYFDKESRNELMEEAKAITNLDNPNSTQQLLGWLSAMGFPLDNLQKDTVAKTLSVGVPANIRRMLMIRQQLGKTSVKKYSAMQDAICDDDRIRGLTQYYGAPRTGRYAGRLIQLQNLTKHHIGTIDEARNIVENGNYEAAKMIYGNVPDLLSQLVRTAIIPSDGCKLIAADFSAIEARVIAWLAGETWVNEVFATHGKIYEATAAQMFHVPIETIKKGETNYDLRQKGKVATLALGYQGGTNALITMGALNMGIQEDELPDIVERWRDANSNIVSLWGETERAAVDAVLHGETQHVKKRIEISLEYDVVYGQTFMTVRLPSGRKLYYARPTVRENKFGKPAVHYREIGTTGKWEETSTYGGRLVENIIQAIARDCLVEALTRCRDNMWDVIFHVHDEIIIDAPKDLSVEEVCDEMSAPIEWAKGLILKAAGFESEYYKKD